MRRLLLPILAFACSMASLQAGPISFDFESQSPTYFGGPSIPGALTSLAVVSGGLTLTITRFGGFHFDLVSNTGTQAGKPAGWGSVSLEPYFTPHTFWVLDFSQPITSFSIQSGIYLGGGTNSEQITLLDGPGGTGKPVGIVSSFDAQGFPAFSSVFTVTPGARSVEVMDSLDNVVYLDNIVVTVAAPEPGSMLLFAIGSLGLLFVYRRKRRC